MPEHKLSAQDEVCLSLTKMEPEFAKSLPPQVLSAKFVRVAMTAIRNNPKLVECDKPSLYSAFHRCAQTGLIPDGREAAIVPFGTTATFMPMIGGITKLARNSGEIKTINAQIVYKNDAYEHWIDESGEHFKHTPARGDRGEILLTYAFCQTKDGGVFFEEIDNSQMKAIEAMARQKSGPWSGPFRTEMMRKSAIRRLLKYRVPSSTDVDDIIRENDEPMAAPEPPKPAETTSSRLRDAVTTTAEPVVEFGDSSDDVAAREELPL